MYIETILRPKKFAEQLIYSRDARKIVAKAMNGITIDPLIFNRGDDGKTLGRRVNGVSPVIPIIFDGGKGFIRIYGVGEAGKEVLIRELGNISTALSGSTGDIVTVDIRQGEMKCKPGFSSYRIGKLALGKFEKVRGKKFFSILERYQKAGEAEKDAIFREVCPMITEVITKGLEGIADQLGNIDLPKSLNINIHEGELSINRIHPDKPGHVGIVKNVRFTMTTELNGPWSVGHLRSHGYGMMRREINQ